MKHLRFSTGLLLSVLGGILLVTVGRIFAVCPPTAQPGLQMLVYNGALVSSGVLLWVTACTALALWAKNGLHAALLVMSFIGSAVYMQFSMAFAGAGYCRPDTAGLMILLLPVSAVCAVTVFRSRRSVLRRALTGFLGVLIFLFDFFEWNGGEPIAVTTEFALLILLFYCLHTAAEPRQKSCRFRTVCRRDFGLNL